MRLPARRPAVPYAMRGVSLVELMIAVVLGLLVLLAALAIFASNRATYDSTEGLGRIQENARVSFEMMARDLREADGTPCRPLQSASPGAGQPTDLPVMNLLTSTEWWANWGDGLRGYDNGALAGSAAGTDAFELHSAVRDVQQVFGAELTWDMDGDGEPDLTLQDRPLRLTYDSGDPVLLCDGRQASLFIIRFYPKTPTGNGDAFYQFKPASAGNCGSGLGVGPVCGATPYWYPAQTVWYTSTGNGSGGGTGYSIGAAKMAPLLAVRWYVARSAEGSGLSLFRKTRKGTQEVISGVRTLEVRYVLPGTAGYLTAQQVGARWKEVRAVRIALELEDGPKDLRRRIVHVVSLRNRNA